MAQEELTTLPVGRLGLVPLESCKSLGQKVDEWLVQWRKEREHSETDSFAFEGYKRDSYVVKVQNPRFGSGEGKCVVTESVRGDDIYVLVDVCNYNISYPIGKYTNLMSPDDHYQDLKRVIAAIGGKARRVNVIMPYLYEGRQSKRIGRESLDCATSLHELINMGVENIITFDAHDPQIQNATPLHGFETVHPSYQFIKALLKNEQGLHIDNEHFMIISPDEGSMNRAIYLANILGVDMGMYYKRLDYSKNVDGRHPIAAYEFLGPNVAGKDLILIDDMISSGETILKIASLLKERGAGKIYLCSTFGLFTDSLKKFDEAHEAGVFDKLLTTNLVYQPEELLAKPYYISCDMSKYIALIIDTLIYFSGNLDYTGGLLGAYAIKVAVGKVGISPLKGITSGILCNILVCIAILMAVAATDIVGKVWAIFFPIMAFVVGGFEHCVANMFYIPVGMMAAQNPVYVAKAQEAYGLTAEQIQGLTILHSLNNFIPVTIGNILGGMVFVGIPCYFIYKKKWQKYHDDAKTA